MKLDSLGRRNKGWQKHGPGRPKLYSKRAAVSLESNTYAELRKNAALNKTTISDRVRIFIEWGLESESRST